MLLNISEIPKGIKLCKILTADKISKRSTLIEWFPKEMNLLEGFNDKREIEKGRKEKIEALQNAIWRMVRACLSDDGIGLAAPQIGIFKRLFVIRESNDSTLFRAYLHPRYTIDISARTEEEPEGCLSVPGKRLPISRPNVICAEWLEFNDEGNQLIKQTAILEGLKARVFMHETDHLNGISILDKYREQLKHKQQETSFYSVVSPLSSISNTVASTTITR